ncbi:MAG: HAD family phosphatase [Deltaproteobacteria bacterium]|nr:HAD family phosphatase [Deltaproteobacteria bacterium]
MPASYFDVDGTLIRTNLLHPTAFYLLNQGGPLRALKRLGRAALAAPMMALSELRDRRAFNEHLYAIYEGMTEDRLLLLADEAFEKVIEPAIFKGARDLIRTSKDRDHRVVFVSGSLDFLVQRLADALGADDVIANRLEFRKGIATGKLLPPVVAGPAKAKILRDHAREHGFVLDDCYAYSDSLSDVPMLSVVGHPAAVQPDAALERLARANQWPVLRMDGLS